MDLTPYLHSLRESLLTSASAGDEQTQRTAALLTAALEPAARLALLNALADLAAEVTAELPEHVVDVRLNGPDIAVAVTRTGTPPPPPPQQAPHQATPPPPPPSPGADAVGDISRMTLRLVDQIKGQAERAAADQGVSLNTFVAQAVQGALRGPGRGENRGEGWGEGTERRSGRRDDSFLRGWVDE